MGELPMKVLLVDDESYMTEYLKKLVDWKSYGFEEVLTASGGSIARDLIEQKKPELLVTDIRMPRVSGLDLVKYIDEKNYPTKTIILSGYSEFKYAQQALRYGVTEYLVKPILKKDFQISLEHVMEKFFEKEESFPDDGISAVKKYIAEHVGEDSHSPKREEGIFREKVYRRACGRRSLTGNFRRSGASASGVSVKNI